MNKTLVLGILFLAGWWYTPKALWLARVLFLVLAFNLIAKAAVEIYRRQFGTLRPEQAFDLVNEVLQPMAEHAADQFSGSWCQVLQVYANKKPTPFKEFTEKERSFIDKRRADWGTRNPDYNVATGFGLIAVDEYDKYGMYALTELGLEYGERGPIGGYQFYLNRLKRYSLENVRSTRNTASATFVLEFERTELATMLKHQPVLRQTFDIKTERTDTGDWFLAELIETGLPGGPKPFPLTDFRNWQAYREAEMKKQAERDKWHDEADVKAALARFNAETDPEKKRVLSEEWRIAGKAARERLGIE